MATQWSPIDPEDVVDLWIDVGNPPEKPFLPADEVITDDSFTVDPPAEVNVVTADFDAKLLRIRVGPCEPGQHVLQCDFDCESGQHFDFEVFLTVKHRLTGRA